MGQAKRTSAETNRSCSRDVKRSFKSMAQEDFLGDQTWETDNTSETNKESGMRMNPFVHAQLALEKHSKLEAAMARWERELTSSEESVRVKFGQLPHSHADKMHDFLRAAYAHTTKKQTEKHNHSQQTLQPVVEVLVTHDDVSPFVDAGGPSVAIACEFVTWAPFQKLVGKIGMLKRPQSTGNGMWWAEFQGLEGVGGCNEAEFSFHCGPVLHQLCYAVKHDVAADTHRMILARQEEKKKRKTPEEKEGLSLLLAEVADRENSMKELRMGVNTMQLQLAACLAETHQNVFLREKNSLLELREKAIKKEAEQLEKELSKTRKQLEVAANALSSREVNDCEARAVIEATNAQHLIERGAGKLERLRLAEKENRIRKVCKSIAARIFCDNATLFLIRWRDAMCNQRRLKRAQGKNRQVCVRVVN